MKAGITLYFVVSKQSYIIPKLNIFTIFYQTKNPTLLQGRILYLKLELF